MEKDNLITIENKKGLLGDKETVNINENKFKDIIGETCIIKGKTIHIGWSFATFVEMNS